MRRYIPLQHDNSKYREDDHQISGVFLSTDKICNANNELIAQLFESITVIQHQVVQQLQYLESLTLRADLQVLKMFQKSACISVIVRSQHVGD